MIKTFSPKFCTEKRIKEIFSDLNWDNYSIVWNEPTLFISKYPEYARNERSEQFCIYENKTFNLVARGGSMTDRGYWRDISFSCCIV